MTIETAVANLFIHDNVSSRPEDLVPTPMLATPRVDAVEGMGLRQDKRYFRRSDPGRDRPRQVSLIDEATIWRHEKTYGPINRSYIKAQIILAGDVYLPDLLGATLVFEEGAELTLSIERKPCFAMDLIAAGLKADMGQRQQGALARVSKSGPIALGQRVLISEPVHVASGT